MASQFSRYFDSIATINFVHFCSNLICNQLVRTRKTIVQNGSDAKGNGSPRGNTRNYSGHHRTQIIQEVSARKMERDCSGHGICGKAIEFLYTQEYS